MNNRVNAFAIAALCAAFTASQAVALTVTTVSHVNRPYLSRELQISGITYVGGNLYYAVDDDDNKLYPLTIAINRSDGSLTKNDITIGTGVAMSGGKDIEGCAFDPCSSNVWISQEKLTSNAAIIREYDPETGEALRMAPLPAIQQQAVNNYSLEALTISGDGKTMWTANEEALTVDGALATNSVGSVVRLTRFTRSSVHDNWTPDGEWAYVTQPIGTAKDSDTRSGVAGLCALPDGTLLTLERRCYQGGVLPDFNIRIYQVNFSGATDVSSIGALKNATYTKTSKTLLWEYKHGSDMPNYEGICLGPRLDDGSCVLVLISDGGSYAEEGVFTLKLSGLSNVREMYFTGNDASDPFGGPYRYVNNASVTASLPGGGSPYEGNLVIHHTWSLLEHGVTNRAGSKATFDVAADDTLRWSTTTNTSLPLLAADSFERIPVATEADGLDGWNGEGWVVATNYTPALPPGYPLTNEVHKQVLMVDGDVERTYDTSIAKGVVLDTMVCATLPSVDSPIVDVEDGVVAFHFDEDGYPILQHSSADGLTHMRTRLSNQKFANGNWLRLTLTLSNVGTQTWCQVRINGSTCVSANAYRSPADTAMVGTYGSWFRAIADKDPAEISSLLLKGTGAVDDVALYTASGLPEFDNNGNATTNSVSYQWLYDNGLPFDTELDVDGDGFKSSQEWRNGANPTDPWDKSDNPKSRTITVFTIQ